MLKKLKDFSEHERALWLATSRHKFEGAIAIPHQKYFQIIEKLDIEMFYKLSRIERPHNDFEIIRKLSAEEIIKEDMEGGYDITNLGAVLFARDFGLFQSISGKTIRVVKYVGSDKSRSENEVEFKKGYAIGFSDLVQYVINRLPTEEKYIKGIRTTVPVYPEIAIREVIANALIHQDFTVSGSGPLVEIYSDRVEIMNPGNSLIQVDRIIDERRSRNEKLASTMRGLGLCEERGGGIDKAIIEIEEKSLPTLKFFPSKNSMRVVLFLIGQERDKS